LLNSDDNNKYSIETNIETKEYTLTELEHQVCKNNAKVATRIVKKASSKVQVFKKN